MSSTSNPLIEYVENQIAFVKRMGLKVLKMEKGQVKLFGPLAGNENHIGSMYAGALFTVAEIIGGAICLSTFDMNRYFPIVKKMTITYLRPAQSDVSVEIALPPEEITRITDDVSASGKAEFILNSEVRDAAGKPVAACEGVYQLRLR